MSARFCTLLLWLLGLAGMACAAEAPKEDQLATARKVREIFEAKCLDCHGPELARPKGKFGYVLDLQRMADNPDYVVRGKPADSELYKLVFNDEMPGEDANVPPLTPEEKDTVKHWVEIGAPGELPEARPLPPAATQGAVVETAKPKDAFWRRALRWIGQSHPVSTHFPIALMFVAVLSEGLAWWTKRPSWMQTTRFLVTVAALGALATTPLGWINAYFSSYNKAMWQLLWWHRWLGTVAGCWCLVCAGLLLIGPCLEGTHERNRFRGALLAGAFLIGVAGFLGSALIYGLDHYAWK